MVYTFYTCTKNIHVLCKMYIDYKYQLSHVITKYIRKQFEYHYIIMILRFHTRKFANEQNSMHTVWLQHMGKLIRSTLFEYWFASLNP